MSDKYKTFVSELLSEASKDTEKFIARIKELDAQGFNPATLIAGGLGLCGEGAEVGDLIKKVLFQGKDLDREHMIKELGDTMFYVQTTAIALGTTIEEIVDNNVSKLSKRYPDGFKVEHSENRKEGDN